MKSEALEKYEKAAKEFEEERERLTKMQTRSKSLDIDSLLRKKADELKLSELKEEVLVAQRGSLHQVEGERAKIRTRIK